MDPAAHSNTSEIPTQIDVPPFRLVREELKQVRRLIAEKLAGSTGRVVRNLLEAYDLGRGKMFRPALVLLCGKACGRITDTHVLVAAIVELIHNATLLHDDVVDEGQVRRGRTTINSTFGNESAVLLGDYILSRVFAMCAGLDGRTTELIASTAARICQGELNQIAQRQNWDLSEAEYIDIITEKSASFFSSSCLLGAHLANADKTHCRLLADFGLDLGICFQIADDLLDIVGDESESGKTLGRDVQKNEPTLPLIHLLGRLHEPERADLVAQLNCGSADPQMLRATLESQGSIEYTRNRAQEYADRAVSQLPFLGSGPAESALAEAARFVIARLP